MKKKSLYEYAILFHSEEETELIVEPTYYLGTNEEEVKLYAARDIADEYAEKMDRVEVIVRPF